MVTKMLSEKKALLLDMNSAFMLGEDRFGPEPYAKEEKAVMSQKVKWYFRDKLDQDIGQFDAEF